MSRRSSLEKQVDALEKKIKEAPANTPKELRKIWEDQLVSLSFELNNLADGDEDNNID